VSPHDTFIAYDDQNINGRIFFDVVDTDIVGSS
jgi:hypothetical protein